MVRREGEEGEGGLLVHLALLQVVPSLENCVFAPAVEAGYCLEVYGHAWSSLSSDALGSIINRSEESRFYKAWQVTNMA